MRRCYICGRETSRRLIVEPTMIPVCLERECMEKAAQLPTHYCSARLSNGFICGGPAAPGFESDGHEFCAQHLQLLWEARGAA